MQVIYFVRHSQYANPRNIIPGRLPLSLSTKGRSEAVILQKYFSNKTIQRIYSSSVLRCKQTAEIIANNTIPILFDKNLLETFSAYQGQLLPNATNSKSARQLCFENQAILGGETYSDLQKRMLRFFNSIVVQPFKQIIVCSHGDPLQSIYYHLSGLPLPALIDEKDETANPLYQPKGSVRILKIADGTMSFESLLKQVDLVRLVATKS